MKDDYLILETIIYGMDNAGVEIILEKRSRKIAFHPYMHEKLEPEIVKVMPYGGLMRISWKLTDVEGKEHHHNFFSIVIHSDINPEKLIIHSVKPIAYRTSIILKPTKEYLWAKRKKQSKTSLIVSMSSLILSKMSWIVSFFLPISTPLLA